MLPITVLNELGTMDKATLLEVLEFAEADTSHTDEADVTALKEVSLKIRSDKSLRDLSVDFSRLALICTSALNKIRCGAFTEELQAYAWGIDWAAYYLFNRLANNGAYMAKCVLDKIAKITKNANFLDDEEKMHDFRKLTKSEFLASYSYISEEEYDNTAREAGEAFPDGRMMR